MSIGSILIGLSLALIVGAWLARPFRRAANPDRAVEYWIAQAHAAVRSEPQSEAEWRPARSEPRSETEWRSAGEDIQFCPRCGRRVGPEDRFCARCGAPLRS